MKHHLLFITTHNLATNPRILKEITSSVKIGFDVSVICFQLNNWSNEQDLKIKSELLPVIFITLPSGRTPILKWLKSVLLEKISRVSFRFFKLNPNFLSQAVSRRSALIVGALKKVKRADLVIGHNPGAMYPTLYAAKKFGAKSIFDFEDYHRGEFASENLISLLMAKLEEKCIPEFDVITSASPLITFNYKKLFPNKNIQTINNVFTSHYAIPDIVQLTFSPLKLFWFSQNIGKDRGLEPIIKAMKYFPDGSITLTLIGAIKPDVYSYFCELIKNLGLNQKQFIFGNPVAEEEITSIASLHHIGIASEVALVQNRDYCLTNKIFMYLLSGNAILLSDTKAQKRFWEENYNIGLCYEQQNVQTIVSALGYYIKNPATLEKHRKTALQLAKDRMNWEVEQNAFLEIVANCLGS